MKQTKRYGVISIPEYFDQARADYRAAKTGRFRTSRPGVGATAYNADYHYQSESEFIRMRELARDIDRNDVAVPQGITRFVDNVLQAGFVLEPDTGDPDLDKRIEDRWRPWGENAEQCDIAGEHNLHELVKFALRQTIIDGDIFAAGLRTGQLQMIEAHRVRTPTWSKKRDNIVHGVVLNQYRRRMGYIVTRDDISAYSPVRVGETVTYPTRDSSGFRQVFHIYHPRRVSQTRGVTALAPIVDQTGFHDDTLFATLVTLQTSSCVTFVRELPLDDLSGGAGAGQMGAQTEESQGDGSTRIIEEIAPGLEIIGNPGEKIHCFSPDIPNQQYIPFQRAVLQLVAINLGMPLVLFLLDAKETNFSGFRGALDQARVGFKEIQRSLVSRFLSPVYLWKLRQWSTEDEFLRDSIGSTDIDFYRHKVHPPRWEYLEPLKDSQADQNRAENFQISPRRMHAERGRVWSELCSEIPQDNGLLIRQAKQEAIDINTEFDDGSPVTWRDVLNPAQKGPAAPKPVDEATLKEQIDERATNNA